MKKITCNNKNNQYHHVIDPNWLLKAILESSPGIIVFALDNNYRYLTFNKLHKDTIRNIWGVEIKVGMNMLDEVIKNHEDRHKAKKGFDRALAGETFITVEEYGDENLSRLYWQIYWSPITSEDGDIIGLTCFNINVTDMKITEEKLQAAVQEKNKLLMKIKEKNKVLKRLSEVDSLTCLYNRRIILKKINNEIEYSKRYNSNFSLLIIDIDDFKKVNDLYGHLAGDEILKKVSAKLKKILRKVDLIGRYGGEEFLAILPHAQQEQAKRVAERIRKDIQLLKWGKYPINISVSIGVSEYKGENIKEFIKKTDNKLLLAKRCGKNRVFI